MTDSQGDKRPVEIRNDVSVAYRYCNALSEHWGLTPYYTDSYDGTESDVEDHQYGVRLPTNEEWVFAANAGLPNSLYSGPKWTTDDIVNNVFAITGNNPVYGEHNQYADYINLTYKELPEEPDYTEEDLDGNTIRCWNNNPSSIGTILNLIDGYREDDYGTSPQNFGLPYLGNYAWTKCTVYNLSTPTTLNDIPLYLPSDAVSSGDPSTHTWTVNNSVNNTIIKIGDIYYKINVRGWHNRIGDRGNLIGTRAVGLLQPNDYGLYDMTGNVAELVEEGHYKGGSFATNQGNIINSYNGSASSAKNVVGFRVCRSN